MGSAADFPDPPGDFAIDIELQGSGLTVHVEALGGSVPINRVFVRPVAGATAESIELPGGSEAATQTPVELDEPTVPFHIRVEFGGGRHSTDYWDVEGRFDETGEFVLESGERPRGCQVRLSGVGIPSRLSLPCRPTQ